MALLQETLLDSGMEVGDYCSTLETTYNYNAELINFYDRIISSIAMGIAFGLSSGIYNRQASS